MEMVKNSYIFMFYNNIPIVKERIERLVNMLIKEIQLAISHTIFGNNNYKYHKEVYKNIINEYIQQKKYIDLFIENEKIIQSAGENLVYYFNNNNNNEEEEEEEEEQPTPKKGKKNKNGAVSIDDADFGFDLDDLAASTSSKKGGKKKKKGADIDDIDLGLDDLAISEGTPKKKDKKKKGGTNIEDLDLQGSISSALAVEKKKISNLDELDFTGAVKVKEGALDDFLGPGGDLTESTSGLESNNGTSYMETSGCNEPEMQKLGKDKILGFYISDDQGKLLFHREFLKQKKRGDEIDPEHGFYEQVKIATQPLWQDSITSYQATVVTNYPVVFGTLNGYIMYIVGSGMYDEIFCQFLLGEIVTLISQLGVKKFTPETWKDTNFMGKFYTALDEMILDGCVETLDQGFIDRQAKLKPFKF